MFSKYLAFLSDNGFQDFSNQNASRTSLELEKKDIVSCLKRRGLIFCEIDWSYFFFSFSLVSISFLYQSTSPSPWTSP